MNPEQTDIHYVALNNGSELSIYFCNQMTLRTWFKLRQPHLMQDTINHFLLFHYLVPWIVPFLHILHDGVDGGIEVNHDVRPKEHVQTKIVRILDGIPR